MKTSPYYLENNEIFSTEKRRFTGIYISEGLFFCNTLSWEEKILIKNIESLCSTSKGCFASNRYFAQIARCSPPSVVRYLTRLRKLKIVKTVSFDGRKRRIKIDKKHLDNFILNSLKNRRVKTVQLSDQDALKNRMVEKSSEYKKKKKGKIKNFLFTKKVIKKWNKYAPLITKHGTNNKTSLQIHHVLKSLLKGEFSKTHSFNSNWLSTNKIPESLLKRRFTKGEILKTIKRLHLYHKEGYEPQNKSYLSRSLLTMIYNPRTGTSWFMKAAVCFPQKIRKLYSVKDSTPRLTRIYLNWLLCHCHCKPPSSEEKSMVVYSLRKFVGFWKDKMNENKTSDRCKDNFGSPEKTLLTFSRWMGGDNWYKATIVQEGYSAAANFLGSELVLRKFISHCEKTNLPRRGYLLDKISSDEKRRAIKNKEKKRLDAEWVKKQTEREIQDLL